MIELRIDPVKLLQTARRLERRIDERFEDSNLRRVCQRLVSLTSHADAACAHIHRPNRRLRLVSGAIVTLIVAVALGAAYLAIEEARVSGHESDWRDIPTVGEAVVNEVLLLAAAVWFFLSLERKRKRERVLHALNELRTLAHLIDIHQLTKSPELLGRKDRSTESSPRREMSAFQMGRYLDYCSEMLALTGKVAALYGDAFEDPEALNAVNDLEGLCIGLQRKIWQKIIILEARAGGRSFVPGATLLGGEPAEEEE